MTIEQQIKTKPIEDGGSAFPQALLNNDGRIDTSSVYGEGGMSLRAYVAAKNMATLIGDWDTERAAQAADISVKFADALIERLKR